MGLAVRRIEKKVHTRQAMMMAALQLVESGQHFSSLSIREVTRQTGVVPTSFYRHFRDMDDLGLNLVDELSLILRQLMRQARENTTDPALMIRNSMDFYISQLDENRPFLVFLTQELTGGSQAVRQAIRGELNFFAHELVSDLNRYRLLPHMSREMLEIAAQLAIQIVVMSTVELLDTPKTLTAQRDALRQRMVRQIQLVFLGAAHWQEGRAKPETPAAG
jgi:AcrR family transcriptional regulator